jgi:uncharacterized protein YprB with RNaseH-like and TPR domain
VLSTAIVDLETSDLDADKAVLLVACVKSSFCKNIIKLRIDEEDKPTWDVGLRGHDYSIVAHTAGILSEHDVVVAHNGTRFDIPFLRTRMLKHKLKRLPDLKIVDPCSILFRKFKMRSNSLAAAIDFLGLREKKTPLNMAVWMNAILNGSKAALDEITKHCVQDVKALEGVFTAVKPYIKLLDDRGSSL